MTYSSPMRRSLTASVAVCSLLWAVSGVSVLAVALHEHAHHAEDHHHDAAIRTALHGHTHESSPDHDHELTTLAGFSRGSAMHHFQDAATQRPGAEVCCESLFRVGGAAEPSARDVGPPPYVMYCALLT